MTIDITKTIEDATAFELIQAAYERCDERKLASSSGEEAREYALAMTALEDAQMRYTRGRARALGVFKPVDLDSEDAIAERRQFLDSVELMREQD